jgi:hypothetical protein
MLRNQPRMTAALRAIRVHTSGGLMGGRRICLIIGRLLAQYSTCDPGVSKRQLPCYRAIALAITPHCEGEGGGAAHSHTVLLNMRICGNDPFMEGGVMLSRTYRTLDPFDAAVASLKNYLLHLLRKA